MHDELTPGLGRQAHSTMKRENTCMSMTMASRYRHGWSSKSRKRQRGKVNVPGGQGHAEAGPGLGESAARGFNESVEAVSGTQLRLIDPSAVLVCLCFLSYQSLCSVAAATRAARQGTSSPVPCRPYSKRCRMHQHQPEHHCVLGGSCATDNMPGQTAAHHCRLELARGPKLLTRLFPAATTT